MSKPKLPFVPIVFGLVMLTGMCAGEDMIELSSVQEQGGKKLLTWSVSAELFRKQSSWEPERQEIPLSPHEAVRIALTWLQKQGGVTNDSKVLRIDLYAHRSAQESQWYYYIDLAPLTGANRRLTERRQVIVLLDGTVVEPRPVGTNAVIYADSRAARIAVRSEPTVLPSATATNTPTMPVGVKGSYETVEARVLKVFAAEDNGAKFRAYLVNWKDFDIVVSDPLSGTDKKEGESITFMANRSELPRGEKKIAVLNFMIMDFGTHEK
jgi:hypothetical protein